MDYDNAAYANTYNQVQTNLRGYVPHAPRINESVHRWRMEEQEQTGRFSDLTAAASRTGVEDSDWPILAKSQQHDDGDDNQKEPPPYSVLTA
ncbi:MAG: hypothetical protein GOMPHAMPRED_005881 [Gomphillus americanus]|uniref:Uncharacterized protein n=1 Tax=Gomphillus americanus TaxID=1940652 RepID=A0A8H3FY30_9LECA|nr:MAG: hypothetical protein GOMPHAMPRED_005881 [Gomphillus americanus]